MIHYFLPKAQKSSLRRRLERIHVLYNSSWMMTKSNRKELKVPVR